MKFKAAAAAAVLSGIAWVSFLAGCKQQQQSETGATCNAQGETKQIKPTLLARLDDSANVPDGMALDPADKGAVILAAPNYGRTEGQWKGEFRKPAIMLKIGKDNEVTPWFTDLPKHPDTGSVHPMGIEFGPDGNLYVADNQYFLDKNYKSRLLRIVCEDGKPVRCEVAADGFKLANAVRWHKGAVYVTDTFFDIPGEMNKSGIWRIPMSELQAGKVHVKPPQDNNPHLLATFTAKPITQERAGEGVDITKEENAGADGATFDSKGNLYVGNFGDGVVTRISFNADGSVAKQEIVIDDPNINCTDGMICDTRDDKIYITDSVRNAILVLHPDGKVTTLWENDNDDGATGLLDQPCEPIIRGDELIVVNFDFQFPGLKNDKCDGVYTISVFKLK